MANFVTNSWRNRSIQNQGPDLSTEVLKSIFLDNADDTAAVTDDFMNDILAAADVPARASAVTLASKTFGTVAVGVFDFADVLFTALTGDPSEQFIVFDSSPGTDATNHLIASWDVTVTPNGGNVTVVVNASGAFKY
jgi:hypothetical protein